MLRIEGACRCTQLTDSQPPLLGGPEVVSTILCLLKVFFGLSRPMGTDGTFQKHTECVCLFIQRGILSVSTIQITRFWEPAGWTGPAQFPQPASLGQPLVEVVWSGA